MRTEGPIDIGPPSVSGLERVDRAFLEAIRAGSEPNSSVEQCLPAMRVLDRLAQQLA